MNKKYLYSICTCDEDHVEIYKHIFANNFQEVIDYIKTDDDLLYKIVDYLNQIGVSSPLMDIYRKSVPIYMNGTTIAYDNYDETSPAHRIKIRDFFNNKFSRKDFHLVDGGDWYHGSPGYAFQIKKVEVNDIVQ